MVHFLYIYTIMKIINYGKKDYYDYLCGTWGEDPLIIYDRKDSLVLDRTKETCEWYDYYFCEKPQYYDVKRRHPSQEWKMNSFLAISEDWYSLPYKERRKVFKDYKEGIICHLAIEVGKNIYIIEIDRYLDDDNPKVVHIDPKLVEKVVMDKRSDAPVSMYVCHCNRWRSNHHIVEEQDIKRRIDNPIFLKTWVSRIIPAEDMWKELYEYLGSLKDKPIIDSRTNEEHIESNGFDKKISFRNVK